MMATTSTPAQADDDPQRFAAADSEGVEAKRDNTTLYLEVGPQVKGSVTIPRLAAPLRSMKWGGSDDDAGLLLNPGLDTWQISWKHRPRDAATLILAFDTEPLLIDEVKPVKPTSDGSYVLPAHLAETDGEKIRYEPQPHKNTVGFWVGKEDSANWRIDLDRPGRFSVAILQGCGKGQGGSDADVLFHVDTSIPLQVIDFKVVETGHWQVFRWVHVGEVELGTPGEVRVGVMPKRIKKAALMDIRAIHLIRLPDAER